jgi:superfamily II DNA helicase RecQ
MRQINIRKQLEQMLALGSQFQKIQKKALKAIMRQTSSIVVIMGTKEGKSMLFILLARYSSGLIVIMMPLVLLRNNIKNRCNKLRIACVK